VGRKALTVDASPTLARIAQLLERHGLEAVLIGNAAAALQGAPVTTVDVDFLFRKTPANLKKLKAIASDLGAVILRPYYPVSGLFRIARDADGLQLDFYVASLADITKHSDIVVCATTSCLRARLGKGPIPSRERQRAVALKKPRATRRAQLDALKKESELALRDQIQRMLALPPERRTHFLRKRIGLRMSCI
jgi:hypothetical protein